MTASELRSIREARNETQLQFAREIGVDETTVWRWENKRVAIPPTAAKLARMLTPALSATA